MALITFLAPDNSLLEKAKAAFDIKHLDIPIVKGLLSEGVVVASSLVDTGTEIIITRGGTASAICNAGLPVTVVEVPITGFDIIRCVEKAKHRGKVIGVVTFPSMIAGIECLNSILEVDLRLYPIEEEPEAEPQVLKAIQDRVNIVIGGYITGKSAQKHNCPYELIESGTESILQAVEEAKRIAYARALEKQKSGLFRAVLDYAYEGIISVDSKSYVTFFNPIAERITNITCSEAIGNKIAQIWPNLDLTKVLHLGEDDLGQILTINGDQKGKPGLLELAHGGTIFLDEIAEMDYITQGKLLRVLQERKVMRLGSDRVIPVDIRVIAAINKDLKVLVSENKFRADLYYRLNVLQLKVPSLRDRKEDIPLLAQFFLNMHTDKFKRPLRLSPSALTALAQYDWPGNVRELKNIMERVSAIHKQELVDSSTINLLLEDASLPQTMSSSYKSSEMEEIRKALSLAKGKYVEAAKILGIDRSTLWRKMKRLGLK